MCISIVLSDCKKESCRTGIYLIGNENIADYYLAVIWGMATSLGEWINKQIFSRGGVGFEQARDCGEEKKTIERQFEWVSSAVNRDKQTHTDSTRGATAYRAVQDTGQRGELGIDL